MIRRGFIDLPDTQVHYREAGADASGVPLLLLHASPGSSKQLEPIIGCFAPGRRVIALDRPGNGDSPPLAIAQPEMADYAAATVRALDALGISSCDVYGTHTGASIAVALALQAPERVRRVIADGLPTYTPERRDYMLARYAPPFEPDLDAAYLLRAFMYCRDQYTFSPWFERTREASRTNGLPTAWRLHEWLVEVLKAPTTYRLGYHAAFRYPMAERLPLVTQPILAIAAQDDGLLAPTRDLVAPMANATFAALPRYDAPDYQASLVRRAEQFLND